MIRRRFPLFRRAFSTLPLQNNRSPTLFGHNKTISELGKLGRVEDARQLFDSMPQRDEVSWNSMISAYTQSGQLDKAKSLFDSFEGKNVRTWTIMLSGYAKFGRLDEAIAVFEAMPERNVVSWNALVNGYVENGDLRKARQVIDKMPERNVSTWNALITGYCGCGMMREANEVFVRMNKRDSVTWMVMVKGYVEINAYREAWRLFLMMMKSGGVRLDQALFVAAFKAITGLNNLVLVESLNTIAVKTGFETDVVVGTSILNAYTRTGHLDSAYMFFREMPEKNKYSWSTMITAFSQCDRLDDAISLYEKLQHECIPIQNTMITVYAKKGIIKEARRIFDEVKNPDIITWNTMLAGYAQNGMIDQAKNIFLRIPIKKASSWSAMISGFVQNGFIEEGLDCFALSHRTRMVPNHSSFTSAFNACANAGDIEIGRQIHSLSIKARCQNNPFVTNALISMYGKFKNTEDVLRVFNTMREKDTVSWNSLITVFSENHKLDDAPGNGSRAAAGGDLVAMTKCRLQARNFITQDGVNGTKKMRRYTSAMPLNAVSPTGSMNEDFGQLAGSETSDMESTSNSGIKRRRVKVNHTLSKEISEINRRMVDSVVAISDEDDDPTTLEGGEGTIVKFSFVPVALCPQLKAQYSSAQVSPIQPLRLLVPENYPISSPILLDKLPVEVGKENEDLSTKAKSMFSRSLRNLSQPMSLGDIARTWDGCNHAAISEYARKTGGGTFSSKYGNWEEDCSIAS